MKDLIYRFAPTITILACAGGLLCPRLTAQETEPPPVGPALKVTGGGMFHAPGWAGGSPQADAEEVVRFDVSLIPAQGRSRPAKAVIHMDSPSLREVLGGPLTVKGAPLMWWGDADPTYWGSVPAQVCLFVINLDPDTPAMVAFAFQDASTPGHNPDPAAADKVGVTVFVPNFDDAWNELPPTILFDQFGLVFRGNVVVHKK